jgi:hypothetical protein
MQQSSVMFFFLIAGFFLFITARGELPTYAAILTGNVSTGSNPASPGSTTPSSSSVLSGTSLGTGGNTGISAVTGSTNVLDDTGSESVLGDVGGAGFE